MAKTVKHFSLNPRRDEDARILSKLNSVVPYMYKGDAHKTARSLLETALDEIINAHAIDWSQYLSAVAGR